MEIRTGTFEVRYHEVEQVLPSPFARVSVNRLTNSERDSFGRLCERVGLPPGNLAQRGAELRDMLLGLFSHRSIRDRIENSLAPVFRSASARRILVVTMLVATHHASVGPGFIRSVVGVDPFATFKPVEALAKEIFEISADNLHVRSAIFSSFVIEAFVDPKEIADAVVEVVLAAATRKSDRRFRILMSGLMAYSSLHRELRRQPDAVTMILGIYERLRYDERVSSEPLFWLQYAIAMADLPKLDAAQEYIRTAYRKAESLPGFETYQIDTQAFRIALLVATREPAGKPVANVDDVLNGLERIDGMLAQDSHRAYAVKVLDGIPALVSARRSDLMPGEVTAFLFWLHKISRSLSALPPEFKMRTGSEVVRARLEDALQSFS